MEKRFVFLAGFIINFFPSSARRTHPSMQIEGTTHVPDSSMDQKSAAFGAKRYRARAEGHQ